MNEEKEKTSIPEDRVDVYESVYALIAKTDPECFRKLGFPLECDPKLQVSVLERLDERGFRVELTLDGNRAFAFDPVEDGGKSIIHSVFALRASRSFLTSDEALWVRQLPVEARPFAAKVLSLVIQHICLKMTKASDNLE